MRASPSSRSGPRRGRIALTAFVCLCASPLLAATDIFLEDFEGGDACAWSGVANPEMCNGIDDNCDSLTDEGFPVGELCSAGIGACYAAGQYVCNAQGTGVDCTAVAGTPTAEVCDGIDNNCNAEVDEGFSVGSACTDGGLGICQGTGVFICNNDGTGVTCDITNPGSVAQPEICGDGIDQDCDGSDLPC